MLAHCAGEVLLRPLVKRLRCARRESWLCLVPSVGQRRGRHHALAFCGVARSYHYYHYYHYYLTYPLTYRLIYLLRPLQLRTLRPLQLSSLHPLQLSSLRPPQLSSLRPLQLSSHFVVWPGATTTTPLLPLLAY